MARDDDRGMMFDRSGHSGMHDMPTEAVDVADVRAAMEAEEFDDSEATIGVEPAVMEPPPGDSLDGPTRLVMDAQTPHETVHLPPEVEPSPPSPGGRTRSRLMMVVGVLLLLVAGTVIVVAQRQASKPKTSIVIPPQ